MQLYNNINIIRAITPHVPIYLPSFMYLLARNKNRLVTLRIVVRDKWRLHNACRVPVLCRSMTRLNCSFIYAFLW